MALAEQNDDEDQVNTPVNVEQLITLVVVPDIEPSLHLHAIPFLGFLDGVLTRNRPFQRSYTSSFSRLIAAFSLRDL
jgi:hypothetical protein